MALKAKLILAVAVWLGVTQAHALCVKANKANLRKGPGKGFPVTWVVDKFTPLLRIDRKGGWYHVEDQDGEKHWVYRSLVSNNMQCMAVRVPVAILRKGPGKHHGVAEYAQADRYTPFLRLDLQGDWFRVQDNFGQRFWVHRNTVWRPLQVARVNF